MPEAKKNAKPQPRSYNAPIDSQISGVRLVTANNQPDGQPEENQPGQLQAPPPALVSKLIDFIKKI